MNNKISQFFAFFFRSSPVTATAAIATVAFASAAINTPSRNSASITTSETHIDTSPSDSKRRAYILAASLAGAVTVVNHFRSPIFSSPLLRSVIFNQQSKFGINVFPKKAIMLLMLKKYGTSAKAAVTRLAILLFFFGKKVFNLPAYGSIIATIGLWYGAFHYYKDSRDFVKRICGFKVEIESDNGSAEMNKRFASIEDSFNKRMDVFEEHHKETKDQILFDLKEHDRESKDRFFKELKVTLEEHDRATKERIINELKAYQRTPPELFNRGPLPVGQPIPVDNDLSDDKASASVETAAV